MSGEGSAWPKIVTLAEARRGLRLELSADAIERQAIAVALDLEALESLEATVTLKAWMDGAVLSGRWSADIVQLCGVSLEPFPTPLADEFVVRVVPPGSPNAPAGGEVVVDPDAEDPPDLLETEAVDVGAYVLEHLAMEIDPFPRRPGVVFEPPEETRASSPFDVLRNLPRR